jgi:hypothetical protein
MLPSILQGSVSQTLCCRTLECGIDSWGSIHTYVTMKWDNVFGTMCNQIGGSNLYFGGPIISVQVGCPVQITELVGGLLYDF